MQRGEEKGEGIGEFGRFDFFFIFMTDIFGLPFNGIAINSDSPLDCVLLHANIAWHFGHY